MNSTSIMSVACPDCGEALSVGGARCVVCGWPAEREPWQPPKAPAAPKKPALTDAKPQGRRAAVLPIFGVLCALAVFNLAVPGVLEWFFSNTTLPDGVLVVIGCSLYGILAAQIGIVAIWGALGPGRLFRRVGQSGLVMLTLWIAFAIGLAIGVEGEIDEILSVLLLAPLLCVAAQAPLWGGRLLLHWRIAAAQSPNGAAESAEVQLRIRDLFMGTAVVAIAFALARLALAIDGESGLTWPGVVICALIVMVGALCFVLPSVWGALGARFPLVGSFFVALFGIVAAVLFTVVLRLLIEDFSVADAVVTTISLVVALLATLMTALLVVRACGYRLAGRART